MTDDWNVFEHSGSNRPPVEGRGWVRTAFSSEANSLLFHIWPPQDDRDHDFYSVCVCDCGPSVETEVVNGFKTVAVTHKAWDGRPGPLA